MAISSSSSSSAAPVQCRQPQLGSLHQITKEDTSIAATLGSAVGIKTKQEQLYLYSVPSRMSGADPFQHQRLKSIWAETEVVVFDFPPPAKEENPFKKIYGNHSEEDLLKIDERLNASLKSKFAEKIELNEVNLDEILVKMSSEFPILADRVAFKQFLLLAGLPGLKQIAQDSTVSAERLSPKQLILAEAQKAGKEIAYIQQEDPLIDSQMMKFVFSSIFPDLQLLQSIGSELTIEHSNPEAQENTEERRLCRTKIEQQIFEKEGGDAIRKAFLKYQADKTFQLDEKIQSSFASKKKTLFVLTVDNLIAFQQDLKIITLVRGICDDKLSFKSLLSEPVGCFWKIRKAGKTVGYLLGSIHLTPNYLHNLNSRINKCFGKSARLAVEIDVTRKDEAQISSFIKARKEKYNSWSPEEVDQIIHALQLIFSEESKEVNFSNEDEKIRFIFGSAQKLKFKIFADIGLSSGIDVELIKSAKASGKPVEDLETCEQYAQLKVEALYGKGDISDIILKMLASGAVKDSPKEGMDFILEQVSLEMNEKLSPMFDAWESGDVEKMDHSKTDSPEETMVMTQRNLNMAKKLFELINGNERIFACVGAAHTAGMLSVQTYLQHIFGFSVERVLP